MRRRMLKSKIHRATVMGADLHYVGSVSVDPELLALADIVANEQVAVLDIDPRRYAEVAAGAWPA